MKIINTLGEEDISQILEEFKKVRGEQSDNSVAKEWIIKDRNKYFTKASVLGFDIYRYSQYPPLEQMLIPHIFSKLHDLTITLCLRQEPIIFGRYKKSDLKKLFIDTGDGGFQIFYSPLEALTFAIFFQANIIRYNSRKSDYNDLYDIVGPVSMRYAMTYDNIYQYKSNYYGPAIINCARVLSKDRLNRFLLDQGIVDWFSTNLNGIETLATLDFEDHNTFQSLVEKWSTDNKNETLLFREGKNVILSLASLHIGEITTKNLVLNIYSVHIQVALTFKYENEDYKLVVSVGNLNTSGLA